ncbi:unnamed protein product [Vicia faba]|uniref:Uncharacterized protein n=1 Tax=Vicia faba TaxID=3906 RepID=A0AAV0YNW3_VICFA|nr:unnamed protein product [Vicia faba]
MGNIIGQGVLNWILMGYYSKLGAGPIASSHVLRRPVLTLFQLNTVAPPSSFNLLTYVSNCDSRIRSTIHLFAANLTSPLIITLLKHSNRSSPENISRDEVMCIEGVGQKMEMLRYIVHLRRYFSVAQIHSEG